MKNLLSLLMCCLTTSAFAYLNDDVSNSDFVSSATLRVSALNRDYETVLKFLDQKQIGEMTEDDLVNLKKVLISASFDGRRDIVQALIEKGLDVNTRECGYYPRGQYVPYMCGTPLVVASYHNHVDVVWYLIERGADIDARQYDTNGETALVAATRADNVRIVDILLRVGADVDIEVGMDDTALTIAREEHHYRIERLINRTIAIRDFIDCGEDWIPFNCF